VLLNLVKRASSDPDEMRKLARPVPAKSFREIRACRLRCAAELIADPAITFHRFYGSYCQDARSKRIGVLKSLEILIPAG